MCNVRQDFVYSLLLVVVQDSFSQLRRDGNQTLIVATVLAMETMKKHLEQSTLQHMHTETVTQQTLILNAYGTCLLITLFPRI